MNPHLFNQTLSEAAALPADERHSRFAKVHTAIWKDYQNAVRAITSERATQTSLDGRSIALVVGHISEWDRFLIQMCSEFLLGSYLPQAWSLKGYLDPNGTHRDFESIEDFNQYQMQHQASLTWEEIQHTALRSGEILYRLFSTPGLMDAAQLERSKLTPWQIPGFNGEVPLAWLVWAVLMEHEGVEHAADLGMSA